MPTHKELEEEYRRVSLLERRKFWEMTAAIFDATVRDAGAALALKSPASPEIHERVRLLRAEHEALERESKRLLALAFPPHHLEL